jgi:radical SAM protein with 4Fe4S-binding SPASM domain
MTYEHFCKILRTLPNAFNIAIHGYGEPLCHEKSDSILAGVKWLRRRLTLVTNGLLFNGTRAYQVLVDRYLESGTNMVSFSVDSFHAHGSGNNSYYEKVGNNIRNAIKIRNKYSPDTKIIIHSVVSRDNLHTMTDMVRFAKITNVDQLVFNDITLYEFGDATSEKALRTNNNNDHPLDDPQVVATLRTGAEALKLGVNVRIHAGSSGNCHWLWNSIYVDIEGNVYPCTDALRYCFGNILNDDFDSVWNGRDARDFRKKFLSDPVDECRKCVSYRI